MTDTPVRMDKITVQMRTKLQRTIHDSVMQQIEALLNGAPLTEERWYYLTRDLDQWHLGMDDLLHEVTS